MARISDIADSKRNRDVSRRWTPELIKGGWTPIANVFLEHFTELDITSSEAMLIVHLMLFKWDERPPNPAFKTLAKRMGMSTTAVRNHARRLEKNGYLQRVFHIGEPNQFHLEPLFAALEAHVKAKLKEEAKKRSAI